MKETIKLPFIIGVHINNIKDMRIGYITPKGIDTRRTYDWSRCRTLN